MKPSNDVLLEQAKGKLRMFLVDTFTTERFSGNPAAVFVDLPDEGLSDRTLQRIATEMNQSMSTFVYTVHPGDKLESANLFRLRWFTPKMEWGLCGHATLASAFILVTKFGNQSDEIRFLTNGGELGVTREGELMSINFPTGFTSPMECYDFEPILKVLFSDVSIVHSVHLCESLGFMVIRLNEKWNRKEFEEWAPDPGQLPSVENPAKVKMVIVTTRGRTESGYTNPDGETYDFVSRVFTPWSGLPEDPVTGSAHTVLGNFWSDILNKTSLYARQCSQRPGDLWLEVKCDRTDVKGQAITVMECQMTV